MKNKYYVISSEGEKVDIDQALDSSQYPQDFKDFIEIESGRKRQKFVKEKPDYIKIANKLGFDWEKNADSGFLHYDHKADLMMRLVKEFSRMLVNDIGFPIYEMKGSNIFDVSHPVVQSYADLYGDRLFRFHSGKKDVVMSYDASYPQFNEAASGQLSYRVLPFAHFSISDCYRHEQSGECMLLYRLRRFFMPDLHPYFENIDEAFEWYPKLEKQIMRGAEALNSKYHLIIDVSSEKVWKEYENRLIKIALDGKQDLLVSVDQQDKGLYWIINADYKIVDRLGQSREIACIQIDVGNAERLGILYADKDGEMKLPVIIHSAIPGGIERYLYMAIEDYPASLPIWLHPVQMRLIPVNDSHVDFCERLIDASNKPIRAEIDDRSESVSSRVKKAKEDLIPEVVVIGDKEVGGDLDSFMESVNNVVLNSKDKPFLPFRWPRLLSQQV